MIRKILNIVINHPYHFYFFLYLTLLIGFYFNENLAGGAMQDFNNYVRILNLFNENYFYNFFNFSELEIDHSPFYFSILKFLNIFIYSDNINFLNFFGSQYYKELGMGGLQLFGHKYILIRFFYLHLSLLSTFLLYLCLREKYKSYQDLKNTRNNNLKELRDNAGNQILKIINEILAEYSTKNKISLIMEKKNIVIGKTELDITKNILALLNTKIKKVELK